MRFIPEVPVLTLVNAVLNSVDLSWLDMNHTTPSTVKRYWVYRNANGGDYVFLGYSTGLTYNDTASMSAGVIYQWYIVCEYTNGVLSGRSNYVSTLISTEYLYAASGDRHLYTIDVRSRLVPALLGNQDFTTEITGGTNAIRMLVADTLLFVSVGTQVSGQAYAFDWATNKSSLIYKSKFPTANDGMAGFLVRNPKHVVIPYTNGYEVWDFTDPANPTRLQQLSLGSLVGNWHPDGCAFDPDGKVLWNIRGDGSATSDRFDTASLSDADALSTAYGIIQPSDITLAIAAARTLVQRRMPANPNVLWTLATTVGWRGYVLPITAGASPLYSFTINGSPQASVYGRCYIYANRYIIMCQTSTTASTYGVVIWDLLNPAAPALVSNLGPLNSPVADIAIVADGTTIYAYLLGKANKNITVVDITNIASPSTLATVNLSGLSTDMRCMSGYQTTLQRDGQNMTLPIL